MEHVNAVEWVEEIRRKYDEGVSAGLSLEVVDFLKDWLFDHILGSDQKYTQYLHEAGIE
jgi:hemerythrin